MTTTTTKTNAITRHGLRWNVNECLLLQREYELLELTVQEIAARHGRSFEAILYKLEQEGFITSWVDARGYSVANKSIAQEVSYDDSDSEQEVDNCDDDSSDYVSEHHQSDDDDDDDITLVDDLQSVKLDELSDRVWKLESTVGDIKMMVKQMFDSMVSTKQQVAAKQSTTQKKPKLRSYAR